MADRVRISTTLDKDLIEIFKKIADKEGRHLNYYIEKGLKLVLENRKRRTIED